MNKHILIIVLAVGLSGLKASEEVDPAVAAVLEGAAGRVFAAEARAETAEAELARLKQVLGVAQGLQSEVVEAAGGLESQIGDLQARIAALQLENRSLSKASREKQMTMEQMLASMAVLEGQLAELKAANVLKAQALREKNAEVREIQRQLAERVTPVPNLFKGGRPSDVLKPVKQATAQELEEQQGLRAQLQQLLTLQKMAQDERDAALASETLRKKELAEFQRAFTALQQRNSQLESVVEAADEGYHLVAPGINLPDSNEY